MSNPGERYIQLEIVRPVIASDRLPHFLAAADGLAKLIFQREDNVSISVNETDEESEHPATSVRAFSVTGHEIYRTSDLKLVLASLRSPKNIKARQLRTLHHRIDSDLNPTRSLATTPPAKPREPVITRDELRHIALAHDNPNPNDTVSLSFDRLQPFSGPGNGTKGYKFALVAAVSRASLQLSAEADRCNEALAANPQTYYPAPAGRILQSIAFMRAPRNVDDAELMDFNERLSEKLPIEVNLGPLEVRYSA